MTDPQQLIQEKLVSKSDNPSPEYHRLLDEYARNPFYDLILKPEEKRDTQGAVISLDSKQP